jgi:hypothetical protein
MQGRDQYAGDVGCPMSKKSECLYKGEMSRSAFSLI